MICQNLEKLFRKYNNAIKLPKKGILLTQDFSNGKYYDIAILIPDEGNNNFILIVSQVSVNKEEKKYILKKEHEIILYFTKKNIENKFGINITKGYFYFILKTDSQNKIIDVNTTKKYKNMCIGFNINQGFSYNGSLLNNEALITENFLFLNEISLLKNINNNNAINKVQNLIINPYKNVSQEIFDELKNYISNKNGTELLIKQLHYIGNTDMSDSVKFLTDFFIFLKKSNKFSLVYIEGNFIRIDKIIDNNICIISDYQIMFID